MGTRNTTKRRRKSKKKQMRMLKLAVIGLLFTIFVAFITYVGLELYKDYEARYESDTSVVFIRKNGTVVTNDVVAFDTGKYNSNELGIFIEETIRAYNEKHGEQMAVKESLEIVDNVATLITTYANEQVYRDFTGNELFMGTVGEAVEAGYTFEGEFAQLLEGKALSCETQRILEQKDLKIAIIKANTKISIQGKILYLSAENVAEYDKNWIVTKDGANIFGKEPLPETETDSVTETDSEIGSEENTEEEETETDTEIIFDFGDEVLPEDEETYSEVYTYIIYK